MDFFSINPLNNKKNKSFKFHTEDQIRKKIQLSLKSQEKWKAISLSKRVLSLRMLLVILNKNKIKYAKMMALEMGKPIEQGLDEIEKCIWLCDFYFKNALSFLKNKKVNFDNNRSIVTFQPLGLILGIMPWNFPFWQVFRFSIPVLLSGNTAILKHSLFVPSCASLIEQIFSKLDTPKNIYQNIRLSNENTNDLIKNPHISAVSFTGSTKAGMSVAQTAGSALKKVLLELGGNDPYLVFSDARLDNAVQSCIEGRLLNAGQSCISAKRIIVVDEIYEQFVEKIIRKLEQKTMGDPTVGVDIGPLVSAEARDNVENQVQISIKAGAKLLMGGFITTPNSAFYPITVLSEVRPGMIAFDEEIFGPVFSLVRAKSEEEAIKLANLSKYGLGAAIFTQNIEKAEEIANQKLNVGMCYINEFVKSDPRLPFGGIKHSGFGRELSINGILEFVNVKTTVTNKC
ncbi:NAD-dependent succinate-semialdehyde dehydrogenase [Candidatus Marinimicrobia bacterium]|nr:NAD-dependent succinate-semialdehyde dehydrogenase [Candidatus Neomarinimicrobiota bacterium]